MNQACRHYVYNVVLLYTYSEVREIPTNNIFRYSVEKLKNEYVLVIISSKFEARVGVLKKQ